MARQAPPRRRPGELSFAGRRRLFVVGAVGLAGLLLWGLAGLPDFSTFTPVYGQVLNRVAVEERSTTDVVTAVNFDYRGFDTLGEEFILFAAVLVLGLLLRALAEERRGKIDDDAPRRHPGKTSDAVRLTTVALVGPTVLLAIYITAHGHLTPGGGFQGGVIAATALLLVYLGGDYAAMRRVRPLTLVTTAKAAGAGGFVLIGLGGLIFAGAFLQNFLPLGQPGHLVAAGTIPLLSLAVGLEVAGGFVLLLSELLDQLLVLRRRRERRSQ
ncbi:MAG TPA: MnhB domain-containing protein [Solirubrobacteraceae bacterium]